MNFQDTHNFLNSFINNENRLDQLKSGSFKLEAIKVLLDAFGNPQDSFKIIHVAGSKGKGSICAMTAQILKEAGFRVGLYTSPHIYDYSERIRILDVKETTNSNNSLFCDAICPEDLCDLVSETKSKIEYVGSLRAIQRLTFYEVFTALAFYYFSKKNIDFAVVETGLGGVWMRQILLIQ